MKALLIAAALTALPSFAQANPPEGANIILLGSSGIPAFVFGALTIGGALINGRPRNGFVVNSIIFGANALTFGGFMLYANAITANEPAGWIAASALVLAIGAITTGFGVYEIVSMRSDGTWWEPPPPPPDPNVMPPPVGPVPLLFGVAPTRDGRGAIISLGGRL